MAELSPDPDTIKYPPGDTPELILSVSDQPFSLRVGLDAPVDLYVEKFHVSESLETLNRDDATPVRFGLFVHEFRAIAKDDDAPHALKLSVSGADGNGRTKKPAETTDAGEIKAVAEQPGGWRGGLMDFYVEDVDPASVEKVLLKATGGTGFSPEHQEGFSDDVDGGDAGDPGQIRVAIGSPIAAAVRQAKKIFELCEDSEVDWPAGFATPVGELGQLIPAATDILKQEDVPGNFSALEDLLSGGSRDDFQDGLEELQVSMMRVDRELASLFSQAVESDAGHPGVGPTGKQGNAAKDGKPAVYSISKDPWSIPVCFAHPVQCRMLLNKAKEYFYTDTDDDLARSRDILQQLGQRLDFLNLVGAEDSLQKPLTQAYRDNALRLFLPPAPADVEPAALSQLRAIKDEASSVLSLLMLNKDYYGNDRCHVPRQSYSSYKQTAVEMLGHLEVTEQRYAAYRKAAADAAARAEYIQNGKDASEAAKSYNLCLAKEAAEDLRDYGEKIDALAPSINAAKDELLRLVKAVEQAIENMFEFKFQDLIDAMGQIMLVHGSMAMVGLQGAGLVDKASSTIPGGEGIRVNKDYLMGKVKSIEGTIESLHEGYEVSKQDGTINLLDPGAEKLQISQDNLNALLDSFQQALGEDFVDVNKAFNNYVAIVIERNNAVLNYNATVALLAKYRCENDAHDATIQSLGHLELAALDLNSPLMEVIMGKIYTDMLLNTQQWLYKAQRAYNFATSNMDNVVGEFLGKCSLSQYNHELLGDAQEELDNAFQLGRDAAGKARQPFPTIRVDLDDDYVQAVKDSGQDGELLTVRLSPPKSGDESGSESDDGGDDEGLLPDLDAQVEAKEFVGMADIRLTKVRVFFAGAETEAAVDGNGDKHTLHVTLTHMGDEVLTTTSGASFKFTHASLQVGFKYILENGAYTGPGTLPGVIGSDTEKDGYALVGPFATWLIDVKKEYNPGLDLSRVTDVWMEFEGEYRPV
ncbi:serine protein [Trichoderma cornu-damae]|uniref:Serine protein n=1 Tax=Trichoderma cornu-damae TaxID=654480 RepID=A0A9P8QM12_9HYPO|nr:serine protein [Trichoderma cornu-damae]